MLRLSRRHMLASTAATTLLVGSQGDARIMGRRKKRPTLNLPLDLYNLDSRNSYAAPFVSYGHAFADGDVPAGGSVTMNDSHGNAVVAQMDAVALWPSGCPRFVVLSHACSETFSRKGKVTYTIGSSTNPPNNTPAQIWGDSPEGTMAANSDFVVQYSGFDAKDHTFTVSLNNIFATYKNFPWGTHNPEGGWERTKVGPACIEWHAWQYLINDTTSKSQGYVRCDMWVKAWSPTGPFEIDVRTSQPNMWNAISQKSHMYNKSPGRWATLCEVKNGSTTIQYAGGPNDYRATTIANTKFNTRLNQINSSTPLFPQQGVVFSSTDTLPEGLLPDRIYWLTQPNNSDPIICTERLFQGLLEEGNAGGKWAANTSYTHNSIVVNGTMYYVCVEAGTSAQSGGPTGTGKAIADGTCKWENITALLTSQGSGTITAYPVNCCYPSTAWVTGDVNGNPLWNGPGNRPPIFPGHDFTYLSTESKFIPCYNINAGHETTNMPLNTYAPNRNFGGILWYQGAPGDGATDQRIGYIDGWGVTATMNPSDPFYTFSSLQSALCYNNSPYSYMTDERGGMPFAGNNGHNGAGKDYRNLPSLIPQWSGNNTPGNTPAFGVGNWLPWSTKYRGLSGFGFFGGQWYVDTTHMPAAWQIPYLKTGRPCFLEQGIHMGNTSCFMQYATQTTLGSTTYHCIINTGYTSWVQLRGWAWGLRSLAQSLYMTPANHAFQPVLADYYSDNAAYQATYYQSYVPSQAKALGCVNVLDHSNAIGGVASWELYFLFINVAMETWRGGLSDPKAGANWKSLLDYMNAYWSVIGSSMPASLYYTGLNTFVYSPNQQGLSTAYQDPLSALTATYNASSNSNYALSDEGLQAPYPTAGVYDAYNPPSYLLSPLYPDNCTEYCIIGQMALKMCAVAEPTNSTIVNLSSQLESYIAGITGISQAQGGIQWSGADGNGVIQNCHTFAVF